MNVNNLSNKLAEGRRANDLYAVKCVSVANR
jgi:hypothetical protein